MKDLVIRSTCLDDLPTLRRICLLTGNSGEDATHLFDDEELLGDFFAAPYAVLEPETCFVLTCEDAVVGYIVGTVDSAEFGRRCESLWFPRIRQRLMRRSADRGPFEERIVQLVMEGHPREHPFPDFPAHLHINLLPAAQGQGWGRKLIECFLAALEQRGVAGVHLGVGKKNTPAIAFYQHLQFDILRDEPAALMMGRRLDGRPPG